MAFICDASVALSWLLPEERSPGSAALFLKARSQGIIVPQLWRWEVANQIGLKQRSGKLSANDVEWAFSILAEIDIALDSAEVPDIATILDIMERHHLTAYDAVYLELAGRLGLPLAAFDKQLIAAARQANISLLS